MAAGHALSGWCAGAVVGTATGAPLTLTLAIAGACSGAALLPDLDHHGSTATTAFGPASKAVHHGVVALHHATCRALRKPDDPTKAPGAHRGITHWWPFPLAAGAAVAALCAMSPWAALGTLAVLFTLAVRGMSVPEYRDQRGGPIGRRTSRRAAHGLAGLVPTIAALRWLRRRVGKVGKLGVIASATAAAWLAVRFGGAAELGPWLGVIVGAGMVLHVAGDAPTESGVPGFRLWTEWRLPRWLAFKAGGWFEVIGLWAPLSIAGVLLLPGVWPLVWPVATDAWAALNR